MIKDYELTTKRFKTMSSIPDEILSLKDEHGEYYLDRADESIIKYFVKNLLDTLWRNQLAFGMVVDLARNLDTATILDHLKKINVMLKGTSEHFNLMEWDEFNPGEHLYKYGTGEYLDHSTATRSHTLSVYFTTVDSQSYFVRKKFDESIKQTFEKYSLPRPSFKLRDLKIYKKGREESERKRKAETDAVVPMFAEIRAEAHLRFNQVIRIKKAFDDVVSKAKEEGTPLPLKFDYEESEVVGERWYFRLWDKESFDLVHTESQTPKKSGEVPFFLEFVKAEKIDATDTTEPEGIWFLEIAKLGLLKQLQKGTEPKQIERGLSFFKQWGYIDKYSDGFAKPFSSLTQEFLHKMHISQTIKK